MKYNQITLKHQLSKVNKEDLTVEKIPISGFRLHAMYDQRNQPILDRSHLEVFVYSGVESALFELDADGNIKETSPKYIFHSDTAEEELVIEKSNQRLC